MENTTLEKNIIIAVANQKGGVGKTTTVINIGIGLKQSGKNVLLIDLDPQNHLSRYLGYSPDKKPTMSELIYQEVSKIQLAPDEEYVRHSPTANIDYISANEMLSGTISTLGIDNDSTNVLTRIFERDFFAIYDYIIIDCKPALDLIVTNALKCCNKLLIPVQSELWAFEGVNQMLEIFARTKGQDIKAFLSGILLTMYRKNTNMSKSVLTAAKESYGDFVFNTTISFRAEVSNSTITHKCPVAQKGSTVGKEYLDVVNEILGGK